MHCPRGIRRGSRLHDHGGRRPPVPARDGRAVKHRAHLLRELTPFPEPAQRRARFHCVLALARAGEVRGIFPGTVEGVLLGVEQGEEGFGYDPLFVPDGYSESFGILPAEVKNAISHRARALAAFQQWVGVQKFLE